jgi:hypothetical protein
MVGMSSQPAWNRDDPGPPAWQRAPAGDLARIAFVLLTLWAIGTIGWVLPNLADGGSTATTLPLPSLLLGVAGLLALLAGLGVGLQSVVSSGPLGVVRGVLLAAVLVGAVVSSLHLVGLRVSASTIPDRRAHALGVCAIVAGALLLSRLLLGVRRQQAR